MARVITFWVQKEKDMFNLKLVHKFAHIVEKALPIMEINMPIFDKHICVKSAIIESEI